MPDPATLTAAAGAATTMGAGFFGWLRGRSEAATAAARAQSEQLATLASIVDQQAKNQQLLMDRAEKQSAKISALSAKLDEVRGQLADSQADCRDLREQVDGLQGRLAEVEGQRDQLQLDLAVATEQIADLSEHVAALSQQVMALGHQPAPAPARAANGQFTKQQKRGGKSK